MTSNHYLCPSTTEVFKSNNEDSDLLLVLYMYDQYNIKMQL